MRISFRKQIVLIMFAFITVLLIGAIIFINFVPKVTTKSDMQNQVTIQYIEANKYAEPYKTNMGNWFLHLTDKTLGGFANEEYNLDNEIDVYQCALVEYCLVDYTGFEDRANTFMEKASNKYTENIKLVKYYHHGFNIELVYIDGETIKLDVSDLKRRKEKNWRWWKN